MKRLLTLFSLVLAFTFVFGASASAQRTLGQLGEMGMDAGYSRTYAVPLENVQPEDLKGEGNPFGVLAFTMHFSDEGDLKDTFKDVVTAYADSYYKGGEYDITQRDDLGDDAYEISGVIQKDSISVPATTVIALDGEYVLGSSTMGTTSPEIDSDVVSFMVDAEPSDSEVTFSEDGTSTGGMFDMMPTVDDIDGLDGMSPYQDVDIAASIGL